jgi:hypothetical protein
LRSGSSRLAALGPIATAATGAVQAVYEAVLLLAK